MACPRPRASHRPRAPSEAPPAGGRWQRGATGTPAEGAARLDSARAAAVKELEELQSAVGTGGRPGGRDLRGAGSARERHRDHRAGAREHPRGGRRRARMAVGDGAGRRGVPALDDAYLRERAVDVEDVSARVLAQLGVGPRALRWRDPGSWWPTSSRRARRPASMRAMPGRSPPPAAGHRARGDPCPRSRHPRRGRPRRATAGHPGRHRAGARRRGRVRRNRPRRRGGGRVARAPGGRGGRATRSHGPCGRARRPG